MTTYKDIHGTQVEVRDDDPANPVNGQIWYNSGTLKGHKENPVGAWSTVGSLNTARYAAGDQIGSASSGMVAGGSPAIANAENWNGSSWTEVNDLNTGRNGITGAGVYTAGLMYGGYEPTGAESALTESWNGSSFSETTDLNTARYGGGGGGTQTAAILSGGNQVANTELWNGSCWTEVNDMNRGKRNQKGSGTSTANVCFGGYFNPGATYGTNETELWNGTSWTEVNNLNSGRYTHGGANDTSTSSLCFGGSTPPNVNGTNKTEQWNGTSWTEVNDLNAARFGIAGVGTTANCLGVGGSLPGFTTQTEEWNEPFPSVVSFTVS